MKFYLLILIAGMLSGCGCSQVDTGTRGLKVRFGEIQTKPLPEGLYFYNPITTSMVQLDVQEQALKGTAKTYTKDVQLADLEYVLNYYPDRDYMDVLYKDFGHDWAKKIIPQIVEGSIKSVIGHYDAVALVGERQKASATMLEMIKDALNARHVVVTKFELTNIDYDEKFEKSVEEKVIAIQKAEQAKNKTVEVQENAKQKIISAEAEAKSMRIRSEALSQNKSLVEYEAVQKWDGKLPQYMMGSATPFLNLTAK